LRQNTDTVIRSELAEHWDEFPFEKAKLIPRKTHFGKFLGSEWQAQMPDGRLLRMYRGLNARVYEQIRKGATENRNAHNSHTFMRGSSKYGLALACVVRLFVSHCDHGIDVHGAAGGNIASGKSDRREREHDSGVSEGIGGLNTEKHG
jgi:hypothetical protein